MCRAFEYLNIIEEINLSGADVSNVTNMQEMFRNCKNLKEIK
jgi:surface protein